MSKESSEITSADQLIPGKTYFLEQGDFVGYGEFLETKLSMIVMSYLKLVKKRTCEFMKVRSMKMSKTIRVQWEYPDFASSIGDENYEDFEVDDDATEEEIDKMAEEIALEHFDWSWWEKGKDGND